LNALIGLPPDTRLALVAPPPAEDPIPVPQGSAAAITSNPEVIEAEQEVVKARAATRISKLDYVPDVAVVGGYIYERAIPLLPRDFSYVGVIATLNIFDFGKREKTISERKTQLAMAEANVDLVKAKVAAGAQKASLDLQRTRKIRDLTRRLAATYQIVSTNAQEVGLEAKAAQAQAEAEMFQAELDYRIACWELKRLRNEE
jgi:outer membrane protein TolC